MDNYISRQEHVEFAKRIDEKDNRQNKRLELLEESVRQNAALVAAVEKLAVNMENMAKEQEQQGKRLEVLEARDGEMWRKVVGHLITVAIGIVVGYIFTQVGM